jgi:hypothetical protein
VKYIFLFIILFIPCLIAQERDTTATSPAIIDTIPTFDERRLADSLFILDEDTIASDTTGLFTADRNDAIIDTIAPIHQIPLYKYSNFILRERFYKSDYRSAADILEINTQGYNFIEYGIPGYPQGFSLYPTIRHFSILRDGNLISGDDLNSIQTEMIDSIEVIPLPRGIIYGRGSAISAVNFLTRDFVSIRPYSRIRFYQGSYGEGMVDGLFNSILSRKLALTIDVTNRATGTSFVNSDVSIWQGSAKLKYFLSRDVNLVASFNHNNREWGFYGGIDVDSIGRMTSSIDQVLYDRRMAPVRERESFGKVVSNNYDLRMISNFGEGFYTDLQLFYHMYERNDFREYPLMPGIMEDLYRKNYVSGGRLRQRVESEFFSAEAIVDAGRLIVGREEYYGSLADPFMPVDNNILWVERDYFNTAGIASLKIFGEKIVPSLFIKQNLKDYGVDEVLTNYSKSVYGADVMFELFEGGRIYGGYSIPEENSNNYEISFSYGGNGFNLRGIYYGADQQNSGVVRGGGVEGIVRIGKVEFNIGGNYNSYESFYNSGRGKGGVFYREILFRGNLDLKAGVNYHFWYNPVFEDLSAGRIDLNIFGEIQQRAIIYIIWENLMDANYYLVKYYPMPERNLRFGVAWELFN